MLKKIPGLAFSVSACTRQPREGEVHGKDYYFISEEEFIKAIENDEFVEWEMVYSKKYYGTLRSEIERIWKEGKHVVFDVDVEGGLSLKEKFGERALSIFVMPPSLEVLESRLRARDTESEESLKMRIDKAEEELGYAGAFDMVIQNNDLSEALQEAESAIRRFLQA